MGSNAYNRTIQTPNATRKPCHDSASYIRPINYVGNMFSESTSCAEEKPEESHIVSIAIGEGRQEPCWKELPLRNRRGFLEGARPIDPCVSLLKP